MANQGRRKRDQLPIGIGAMSIIALLIGLVIAAGSADYGFETGMYFGGGLVFLGAIGVFIEYLQNYQRWYCAKCDQKVGRGPKPQQCPRCGSNRLTTSDPMKKKNRR